MLIEKMGGYVIMMLQHVRKPKALLIYESLRNRVTFSLEDKITFRNLVSGYEGEKIFSSYLFEKLHANYVVLYDVLFDENGTVTQVDCFIFLPSKVVIVEVKNFQGEFSLQNEQFISLFTNKVYQNPLHQLKRTEINFRQLLHKAKVDSPIETYVVFVNNNFTLFMEKNKHVILPTQIDSFFAYLNQEKSTLSATQLNLVEQVKRYHSSRNPMERFPIYNQDTIQNGITCYRCGSWMTRFRYHFYCNDCKLKESLNSAVLRSITEFHLLFPNEKITSQVIWDWTARIISRKTIIRILNHFLIRGTGSRNVVYLFRDRNNS